MGFITAKRPKLSRPAKQDGYHTFAYNIDKGLRGWFEERRALDNGANKIINLIGTGDSTVEGTSELSDTVANFSKGWLDLVRTEFAKRYGDVGEGWIGNRYPVSVTAASKRWTYTGTWNNFGGFGWLYNANAQAVLPASNTGTATCVFNGTGFKLLALCGFGNAPASCTVSVDGGAAQAWAIPSTGVVTFTEYVITGLDPGDHTVVVTATATASSTWEFWGGYELKGTRGVRVNKLGMAGGTSAHLAHGVDSYWTSNGYPNISICSDYWNPALNIVTFLANDFNTQVSLGSYRNNWNIILKRLKMTSKSILVTTGGGIFNAQKDIPIEKYRDILYQMAMDYDVGFLDIAARWGGTIASSAKYRGDSVHFNSYLGHPDHAQAVLELILA